MKVARRAVTGLSRGCGVDIAHSLIAKSSSLDDNEIKPTRMVGGQANFATVSLYSYKGIVLRWNV